MQHIHDMGVKVGTALASIGSFVVAQALSDALINELVRLLSSSIIAALGAVIGYLVTRWLKKLDSPSIEDMSKTNAGGKSPAKHSARYKKTQTRKRFTPKSDES